MFPGALNLLTFHIESKDGPEILEDAYRLRYNVYCEETHFLNKDDYPSGIETDQYDASSEHILSLNMQGDNRITAGTVRLVKYSDPLGFPTNEHYAKLYELLSPRNKNEIAEISRLCISKEYRRRLAPRDGLFGIESYLEEQKDERRRYPVILLHLFKKMYVTSNKYGIKYWIASMEETLFRVLDMYAITFEHLGEDTIEYYGKVRLFIAEVNKIEERMSVKRPDLWPFFKL